MKKTKILSLLLCLSLFCALNVPSTRAYADNEPDSGMKISKTATANEDGTYTITAGEDGLALKAAHAAGDTDKVAKYAELLYDQALLIAGLPIEDPVAYAQLVCGLMQ